jgi:putative ABC transport system permease protein
MLSTRLSFAVLVGEAVEALSDNRLRSALSLLGVSIGIASILVVSSIASSGRQMVFAELETFGLRSFWVFRTISADDRLERDAVGSGIVNADYRALLRQQPDAVSRISPVVDFSNEQLVVRKGSKTLRVRLQGVAPEFAEIKRETTSSGRFFSDDDTAARRDVAVIGPGVAEKLFVGQGDPVGQKISIGDTWFIVVGVLEAKSRDLISSLGAGRGEETSDRVLIPYTTRQKLAGNTDVISYLQGQAADLNRADEAIRAVIGLQTERYGRQYRYAGESMSTYVATANRILNGVALVGIVAAAVSLLVGGLAIMNIMTTSVIERTREIGVRRAIGATQLAIRMQFLLEGVLISLAGGAAGLLLGLLVIQAVRALSTVDVTLSWGGLLLALVSTFTVGIVSGYFPARAASRLAPVAALRHA